MDDGDPHPSDVTARGDAEPLAGARADDALRGDASQAVVRGAAARGATFALSTVLLALAFAVVFRAMDPDVFGYLAVAIAIATIVQNVGDAAMSAIALRQLVAADAPERPRLHGQLVGARLVLMPVPIVIGVVFSLVAYDASRTVATAIICLASFVAILGAAMVGPLTVELRAGRAAIADFVRQIGIAVGLIVCALLSGTLSEYALVYLVASAASLVAAVLLVERPWRRVQLPSRATLRSIAWQTGWLTLAITVNSLFLKVLTVLASLRTSAHETGLFGAATRVTEVVAGLSLVVAGVAYPLLTHAAEERDWPRFGNALHRVVEGVLLVVGAATVGLVVGAEPLMRIFAGTDYIDAGPVLQVQAIALLIAATTQALVWALLALQAERALVVTNLVGLVTLGAVGYALIGDHGAYGAALSAVVGELVLLVATLVALGRQQRSALPAPLRPLGTLLLVGASIGVGLVLPLPALADATIAVALFAGAALMLRLVPAELLAALPGRRAIAP